MYFLTSVVRNVTIRVALYKHSMEMTYSSVTPRVFLSFAIEHKPLVEMFRGQARNDSSGLVFHDYSIKEPVEGTWKNHAERLIRASSVTICLVGESTWRSEPVNWEVRKSAELGKRVLAVYLQSDAVRSPAALLEVGVTPMPWDIKMIVDHLYDERRQVS